MSNRDRIAHLRAEADATAKEKAVAKAEKAALPPAARKPSSKTSSKSSGKSAASTRGRVRIVWLVCDPSGKEVKQFPYAQEVEARAEALQLSTTTKRMYFVKKADVPAN